MEEIINLISKRDYSGDFISVDGSKERISSEKFVPITPSGEGDFLFVDGGNAELMKSPDFSLQFIRVLGIHGKDALKKIHLSEFYCLVRFEEKDNKKVWNVKNSFVKGNEILPKNFSFDDDFQSPSAAAEFVRRLSEIAIATDISKTMLKGDIILLDGALEANCRTEADFLLNLHHNSRKNGVLLCSLAKTTTMQTIGGNSIISAFNACCPAGKWCYQIKKSVPRILLAKLHESSAYIFKFETNSEDFDLILKILGALSLNSKDPVFLGYPFGLIEADRLARVSNREKEILKLEFSAKLGSSWKEVEKEERALNAHSILDNIG